MTANNLQDIDVEIPIGRFVSVTGVSGSGKSTLVNDVLYRALANRLLRARLKPGAHRAIEGLEQFDKVIEIDQSPIGRTPRSNPATYTDLFSRVRELYSLTPEARTRGYTPGRFSFNVKGGRCEACAGDGMIRIEMHFLPDVYVPCEVCKGKRYNRETLDIRYKGASIADVLAMSVEEALEFFGKEPKLRRRLQTLHDVGLGYVQARPARDDALGRRGAAGQARGRALQGRDRAHALHPRRADHRPAHPRRREAARGAAAPGRRRQHGARDRAQPRRDQAVRLGHRPRPGGRRRRRARDRDGHARAGRRGRASPTPASSCAASSRRRTRRPPRRSRSELRRARERRRAGAAPGRMATPARLFSSTSRSRRMSMRA